MKKNQQTFSDIEYRKGKRAEFLEKTDEIIPWNELIEVIQPYYHRRQRTGRPPRALETMLGMYLPQIWFNLSDEGTEDGIYDSYAMKQFAGTAFAEKRRARRDNAAAFPAYAGRGETPAADI